MDRRPSQEEYENYYDKLHDSTRRQRSHDNNPWKKIALISIILVLIFAILIVALAVKVLLTPTGVPGQAQATPTLALTPTILPAATPTTVPGPTPTPAPQIGSILCQADTSNGWGGWNGTADWKVSNGMLLDNGTNNTPGGSITAPCQLSVADYAVEVTMQVVNFQSCCIDNLGIMLRSSSTGEYDVGVEIDSNHLAKITTNYSSLNSLASAHFDPGLDMHTYRAEVKGNTIKLFIDGGLLVSTTDNQYSDAGQVGLYSSFVQVDVTSFKVTAL